MTELEQQLLLQRTETFLRGLQRFLLRKLSKVPANDCKALQPKDVRDEVTLVVGVAKSLEHSREQTTSESLNRKI